MRQQLLGKDCTLIEDGWSNIHNDPVSAMCLHVENEAFFLEAVDTTSNKKTAEYCKSLVQKAITSAQEIDGCHVRNIVTDNAKSMEKMRRLLKEEDEDLIVYGCSSHMLNLLGQSVTQSAIIKHIVDIQKYFRNHHVPSALLKEMSNTVKPQLPCDTRWNSQLTCIETFIRNRPAYLTIVHEHEDATDSRIAQLVNDFNLYKQAKDMSMQLKPIAVDLDRLQSDKSGSADACHEWLSLLSCDMLKPHLKTIQARFEQAIQPFHIVAYILHPKYRGALLSEDQREAANQWGKGPVSFDNADQVMQGPTQNPLFLPLLVAYDTQTAPFPQSFFCEPMLSFSPILWWKGVLKNTKAEINHKFSRLALRLLSAPASSASIERIFSNFGYIHNKLRNRLGGETAAKLVFCYRMLRGSGTDHSEMDNDGPMYADNMLLPVPQDSDSE